MAIEKTNLYNSTSTLSTLYNLYNYLLENAVPEYFDSVVKASDDSYITCTVNGKEFVKFKEDINPIIITLANDLTYSLQCASNGKYGYAIKTKHAISIGTYYLSSRAYATPIFTICKDNDGNTTLIFDNLNFCDLATSSDYQINAINTNTTITMYPTIRLGRNANKANNITGKTVLCPIIIGDTENYTPNVFLMPYAQNRSEGKLHIDGAEYYSNGIWCVKDE